MTLQQLRAENMRRTLAAGVPVSTEPMRADPGSPQRSLRAAKYALRGHVYTRPIRGVPRKFRPDRRAITTL